MTFTLGKFQVLFLSHLKERIWKVLRKLTEASQAFVAIFVSPTNHSINQVMSVLQDDIFL